MTEDSDRRAALARIRAAVESPRSSDHLAAYFREPQHADDRGVFAGRWFDRLAGGGNRPEVADTVTGDDLVAVSLLDVDLPPEVVVKLLVTKREALREALAQIPVDLALEDADPDLLKTGPPAKAWRIVKRSGRRSDNAQRWVTAGKVLARKRPHLVPVYDKVVRRLVQPQPGDWWLTARAAMRDDGIRGRLRQVRTEAAVPDEVTDLRVLDVVLWMEGRRARS